MNLIRFNFASKVSYFLSNLFKSQGEREKTKKEKVNSGEENEGGREREKTKKSRIN